MSKEVLPLTEDCEDCLDKQTLRQLGSILMEEIMPVAEMDGEPLFTTKEEAELYAETIKGCKGYHEHTVNGVKLYMPCESHSTAVEVEYFVDELGEKRKKKKRKYPMLKYISYLNRTALNRYDLNECIKDMQRQFGYKTLGKDGKCKGKNLARCMCMQIKNNR